MSSAYSFTGGSLRLKSDASSAIQGGKVSKKRKHKSKSKSSGNVEAPSSKMEHVTSTVSNSSVDQHGPSASGSSRRDLRTPAEIAYAESMAKRAEEKILKKAAKSHKEQVEELNSYLDKLTEYNDIPKIEIMSRSMEDDFTYFVKIQDDHGERFYLKSSIDERTNTIMMQLTNLKVAWVGTLSQQQVRSLAKKFPPEQHDSFYSHTQRAFSKGNHSEADGKNYVFHCKHLDKHRLEFVWKQMVDDLNSLKIIGSAELQERPIEEILAKMMDHAIDEMETLRSANEQKIFDIQRINGQLNKALETVKQTVDMKEKLEGDLYRKFVLVLNSKKGELVKLKRQIESYEHEHTNGVNGHDHSDDEAVRAGYNSGTDDERSNEAFANLRARSTSPVHTTTSLKDANDQKRSRTVVSDTDTSGDEDQYMEDEIHEIQVPIRSGSQSEIRVDPSQDCLLDLGDDRMDYRPTTISKHHQRRKYVTGVNSISTRSFLSGAGIPPTLSTPSLPEESQTTDDLLDKI